MMDEEARAAQGRRGLGAEQRGKHDGSKRSPVHGVLRPKARPWGTEHIRGGLERGANEEGRERPSAKYGEDQV